jgi:hypothetical protein
MHVPKCDARETRYLEPDLRQNDPSAKRARLVTILFGFSFRQPFSERLGNSATLTTKQNNTTQEQK